MLKEKLTGKDGSSPLLPTVATVATVAVDGVGLAAANQNRWDRSVIHARRQRRERRAARQQARVNRGWTLGLW